MSGINLAQDQLKIVRDIVARLLPDRDVVVFGSRAGGGTPKNFSDLDICVMGDKPLGIELVAELKNAFSDSDLSIKVDIVEWASTDAGFRQIITSTATPLFPNR